MHPPIIPLQVNLNNLAKKLGVGSGNLRFAEEAAMLEKLKVRGGFKKRSLHGNVNSESGGSGVKPDGSGTV